MRCAKFESGRCRSCAEIETPYAAQLARKDAHCRALLAAFPSIEWLPPVASPESGFRNKAKMVVSGSADAPVLGLLDVDLSDCPLYPVGMQAAFAPIAAFIARARIEPYDVAARRGELKFVLLTRARHSGATMLRFVLRSQEPVSRIRKHLDALLAALPGLEVVSVNLQPEHKAIIEGEREIVLTPRDSITMQAGDVPLYLKPRSFFQTNDFVVEALYARAREWLTEVAPRTLWDLYCGVGGFALSCAGAAGDVLGIELSAEAIESATRSRDELGFRHVRFVATDALDFVRDADILADAIVVNPPRRGIGAELARRIDDGATRAVLYSSCNAETLARDLGAMKRLKPVRAQVMDMFPHTAHYEVLTLLA